MDNECLDVALSELRAHGIEPAVERGGKHIRLRWQQNGQPRNSTVPVSASDWRASLNTKAQIRAILKGDGLIGEPTKPDMPVVLLKDGHCFCTTQEIARHFGKAHKNVLRDVDRLIEETGPEFARLNFEPSEYIDPTGRKLRLFNLSRDGFSLLAMGFTGAAATEWKLKYLEAFNMMEEEIRKVLQHQTLPADVTLRIEKLENDLNALIDLSLAAPRPQLGYIIIPAHKRRIRGTAAA